MWTELSNLSVGVAFGGSASSGMSNISFRATHRPGDEENWSLTVTGQEQTLFVVTLQTQTLNDASLHSKQSVKSQQTKGRREKCQRRNHAHILCTKRNIPCIHPPTVTVDKKQEQATQVLPHPSTSHCKHLHRTGVSQCLTACSVPDRDLRCLSPSRTGILLANAGEPHAASPDSAQRGNKRGWKRN